MIPFFRKIRKQLSDDNQILKYSRYAIGEIVLVVIGILIALQVNNWNEDRKLKRKESSYYCKLLEDISQDAQQINQLIDETSQRIYHSNKLIALLQENELNPSEIVNEMFQAVSLVTYTFKPSTSAFDDIKSSGNLNVLSDEQIKNALINYYVDVEGIVDVVDINSDQAVRMFYNKDNYARFGWQLIDLVDSAIDSTMVDKARLKNIISTDKDYREKLMSDAIFFVGSGARVKMLYQNLSVEIGVMQQSLQAKCDEK